MEDNLSNNHVISKYLSYILLIYNFTCKLLHFHNKCHPILHKKIWFWECDIYWEKNIAPKQLVLVFSSLISCLIIHHLVYFFSVNRAPCTDNLSYFFFKHLFYSAWMTLRKLSCYLL